MPKSNKNIGLSRPSTRRIYMDNASGAGSISANPSAIHELGVKKKTMLEKARKEIASILGAHSDEVIFTSGATESNNLAIIGLLNALQTQGNHTYVPHIVTTNIEHASVLEVCKYLEKTKRAEVTYVGVEKNGIIDPKKIKKALRPNTVLVSVIYANNEIGTVQPIREIAKEVRHYRKTLASQKNNFLGPRVARAGSSKKSELNQTLENHSSVPLLHTDATQAVNYLPVRIEKLGVDMMSFNGVKIYGPRGMGVLFKKRGAPLAPIMFGGDQESGLRPGTENVEGAGALARALSYTEKIKEKEAKRLSMLRDYFLKKISALKSQNQNSRAGLAPNRGPERISDCEILLNGDPEKRLPNNVNITIKGVPSDLLVLELSARGIYVSEKSACKTGEKSASHVLRAINGENAKDHGSLRFSMGRETTKKDIDYVIKSLREILQKLSKWYN